MFSCTQHVAFKYIQIWHWFCVFITSLVEAWFKYIMMLCPLNVVLKLNRFVNVTCSFNIRGEYFKARFFSIPLACCFFTNQLTGFFVPLHNVCRSFLSLQARPVVLNLTILISCYVVEWFRWTLNHSVLLDLVSIYISTLVCLEDWTWCGLIGSLQKNNHVAVCWIRVCSKLGWIMFL